MYEVISIIHDYYYIELKKSKSQQNFSQKPIIYIYSRVPYRISYRNRNLNHAKLYNSYQLIHKFFQINQLSFLSLIILMILKIFTNLVNNVQNHNRISLSEYVVVLFHAFFLY